MKTVIEELKEKKRQAENKKKKKAEASDKSGIYLIHNKLIL